MIADNMPIEGAIVEIASEKNCKLIIERYVRKKYCDYV
jgi:hypothetical protein